MTNEDQSPMGADSDAPVGGSRTFAGVITVTWTPATTGTDLHVTITASGGLVKSMKFTPDSNSQPFDYVSGSNKGRGKFEADYYADGLSGILTSKWFRWIDNGIRGRFSGTIGEWPGGSSSGSKS